MAQTVLALFLILHGLVHAILALVPEPNVPDAKPATFFSPSALLSSLGLAQSTTRVIALVLAALAAIGFIAAGLALLGILLPFSWWRSLSIVSAVVSLLLLLLFWNRYLIVGAVIDVVILVTLIFTSWTPQ